MSTKREPQVAQDTAVSVGFQGETGAYSEEAVKELLPSGEPVPFPSVHEVFEATEIGSVSFGVVPIENSHAGSINETYDLLVRHGVRVVAETIVRIRHCLLAPRGTSMGQVRVVFSHPQALEQCEEFLASLGVERVAVHDTAGAARTVAEEARPGTAAIASAEAAEIYGLEILATEIEDRPDNSTKFVAIAGPGAEPLGQPDKTSIVFSTPDVPGALYACIKEFADRGINLSKLESRPSRARAWQYHFYMDFDAAVGDPQAQEALTALSRHTSFLRVLGSYPRSSK